MWKWRLDYTWNKENFEYVTYFYLCIITIFKEQSGFISAVVRNAESIAQKTLFNHLQITELLGIMTDSRKMCLKSQRKSMIIPLESDIITFISLPFPGICG